MSAFEDFINAELPLRIVLIKGATATGDPNSSAEPLVTNAPDGTFYLREDVSPKSIWFKETSWIEVGGREELLLLINDLQTELDATQTGVGTNADGTYNTPSGTNFIDGATDIHNSTLLLDSAIQALKEEIDLTQGITGAGLETDGSYLPNGTTNYLGSVTSLKGADEELDSKVKDNEDAISQEVADRQSAIAQEVSDRQNAIAQEASDRQSAIAQETTDRQNAIAQETSDRQSAIAQETSDRQSAIAQEVSDRQNAIQALQEEVDLTQGITGSGLESDGSYSPDPVTNYIGGATSLKNADNLLDVEVKANADALSQEITNRVSAIQALQEEIDLSQGITGAGLESDGSYSQPSGTNFLGSTNNLKEAVIELDTQLQNTADQAAAALGIRGRIFVIGASGANISNEVRSSDNNVLDSFRADSLTFAVNVMAIGDLTYKPTATVNGVAVSNFVKEDGGPEWNGSATITVGPLTGTIEVVHGEGVTTSVDYEVVVAPEVQTAVFTGGYPASQTELKQGDTFQVQLTSDVDMEGVEIQNYGASDSVQHITFAPTTSQVVTFTVGDRGDTPTQQGLQLRVHDADNSYGSIFTITPSGNDGVDEVVLNNVRPSISFGNPIYPAGQAALKDSESATLTVSVGESNGTPTSYSSTELDVSSIVDSTPSPVGRISGGYRIFGTNITATAYRDSNGTSTIVSGLVKIAHDSPVINISTPTRLRSGGNQGTPAQNHTVTISSDQQLYHAPSLSAPVGAFQGGGFSGGPSNWSRSLQIHDNDTKGTFTFTGLSAQNLAGRVVTTISSGDTYSVGGFVRRRMTFPAFGNDLDIGVETITVGKLSANDLGGTPFGYVPHNFDAPGAFTYTIEGAGNNILHVNDINWVNQNSTGSAWIEIEETI